MPAGQLGIKVNKVSIALPYWEAKKTQYGAVVIVKGGEQPQWSPLLAHFAKQLSQYGWSVVLLNCNKNVTIPWISQLPPAIGALRKAKNNRIILLHYGDQLTQSLDYFSKPQAKGINGMILLSAFDDQKNINPQTSSFRFPLFDIVGQFDYDWIVDQMLERGTQYKRPNYLALEVPGAQHDYEYSRDILLSFVHGWMIKLPESKPESAPILVSYIEPVSLLESRIISIREDGYILH